MNELDDLYQELILDHNRRPRNRGTIDQPDYEAEGFNPLCGDRVHITLKMDGDNVCDIAFEGQGCAISTASASIMTETVKGRSVDEITRMFESFHKLVAEEESDVPTNGLEGKLAAFGGVRRFPARVKCATLAWHALKAAMDSKDDIVSTET